MAIIQPLRRLDERTKITAQVTVTRELRARLWLALRLFRLGAWVLGPRVRFETTDIQDSEEHY